MSLTAEILACARDLGFDRAALLPVGPPRYAAQFSAWLAAGYHGEMAYLARRAAERLAPARWAPEAATMIVAARSYALEPGPAPASSPAHGRIARYARWPDYHETIKPQLYALDAFIRARTGRQALGKAFVDAAPVQERDFAGQAGLGFIGRNTCLITPGLGSWTFLAGLLIPERLAPEGSAAAGHAPIPHEEGSPAAGCGRCTRCLDACPTRAFTAPHVLDARRCISYLTIELRGPIPRNLRPQIGDWVFGCDICQEVCPYNRRAAAHGQGSGLPSSFPLPELLALDEAGFRARFRGTAVLRAKRRGLVRNACTAAGNTGDPTLAPALIRLLADPEPLVRGHAAWALGRIGPHGATQDLAEALAGEADPWVREELALARDALEG